MPSAPRRRSFPEIMLLGDTKKAAIRVQRMQRGKASRSAVRAGALVIHRSGIEEATEAKEEETVKATDSKATAMVGKRFAQTAAEDQAIAFAATIAVDETGSIKVDVAFRCLDLVEAQG